MHEMAGEPVGEGVQHESRQCLRRNAQAMGE